MKLHLDESLFEEVIVESKYSAQNAIEKATLKNKLQDDPTFSKYFTPNLFAYSVLHHPFSHVSLEDAKQHKLGTCVYIPNDLDDNRYSELMHKMLEHFDGETDFLEYLKDLSEREVIVYKDDNNVKVVKLKDVYKELNY